MITLYTSVGRYELRKNENGEKQPIVKVDQKEIVQTLLIILICGRQYIKPMKRRQ